MRQRSFLDVEFEAKRKKTRREVFLEEMDGLVPWAELEGLLAPHYPKASRGRRPYPLSVMLRVHCLQLFYNMSDPGLEDALYETASMRRFAGISALRQVPDETTILHFRHFLENFELAKPLFETINAVLAARGCRLSTGTIVDASIIHAPSSTKNRQKARDPEMHQTKKGKQWYFGMKLHVGADKQTGLVHTATGTAANVADVAEAGGLMRGDETDAYGDAGYAGAGKRQAEANEARPAAQRRNTDWHVAMRKGKRAKLAQDSPEEAAERGKASIRAKVEHAFRWVKGIFGYSKVRYRGIRKNMCRFYLLLGFANLLRCGRRLAPA